MGYIYIHIYSITMPKKHGKPTNTQQKVMPRTFLDDTD